MLTKRQSNGFITVVLATIILACGTEKQNSRTQTFLLLDSLYSVSLEVPADMDSFYTWVDNDDTYCAELMKYRFSDSKYRIIKESGFIWKETPDSSYRLTFSHINNYDCRDSVYYEVDLDTLAMKYEESAKYGNTTVFKVFKKETKEIGGVKFQILKFQTDLFKYTEKYPSTFISSFVYLDSIQLSITYECSKRNCDTFLRDMEKSLGTIKIKKI